MPNLSVLDLTPYPLMHSYENKFLKDFKLSQNKVLYKMLQVKILIVYIMGKKLTFKLFKLLFWSCYEIQVFIIDKIDNRHTNYNNQQEFQLLIRSLYQNF